MAGKAERIPRSPKGVGPQGRKLWAEVLAEHELTQAELAVLAAACRCVGTLERLADALSDGDLASSNAAGAVVVTPLLVEQRLQSAVLTKLLASLRLPDDSDVRPQRRGGARGAYGLRAVQ